jgi:hypothetical protein
LAEDATRASSTTTRDHSGRWAPLSVNHTRARREAEDAVVVERSLLPEPMEARLP